ncbi:beach-domain-containing protein [Lindgomyces ingoldianus]|uniref:Beach-domain-containing protein n=1 Tax=Lindgomyces ingoldianus TaxID=673940 RepID=A0ACB6QBC1_9PLEO|nr:beach-domain-containing protein [Lindgomyces ingoldianus]KAF2464229.1 beach-domain-containing protein [Lindgomyces ingoldianus]
MNNQIAELRSLADELIEASETRPPTSDILQSQSNALRRMRQLLIESHEQTQTKDAFRHIRGFDVLLSTLRSVSGFYNPLSLSVVDRVDFFEVIKATLDVLSEALNEHSGNGRFFAKRVEAGGWSALEQALGSTGIFGGHSDSKRDDAGQEQLFGCLFAFALGEEAMTRIFRDIDKIGEAPPKQQLQSAAADCPLPSAEIVVSSPKSTNSEFDVDLDALRNQLQCIFSGNEVLQNPDIIPIILHFWSGLSGQYSPGTRSKHLSVSVLLAILQISTISTYNQAALHVTGLLSDLLPLLFENKCGTVETHLLRELADRLMEYGINKLDDAYYLFRTATTSEQASEFLLQGMQASRGPPFIQFDLSLQGFSAIELKELGRPFPPTAPGSGYTFTAWIRVDEYDPNCHTTIFGAYDETQTCFLMAYLEKDTRCLILQTYMGHSTGVVPSVRFKKAPAFNEGQWYHIAVVHRRAKGIGIGAHKASLYVDGEFTETIKAHYPSPAPLMNTSHESFASITSNSQRHYPICAFLGTPRNLAPRLGRNVLCSKISLASFHLVSEPLSDELIAVYNKLGPRYCGNFQDRLGSFQTYRTSAELHVQNEILHPGKEEHSDIVAAIRSRAGQLLPESKILLSLSPTSVMDDDDRNNVDESQLIRSLSKDSARALHRYTRVHGTPIIINAAVPSVNDALSQSRGFGRLSGDPVVVVPQALDDAVWRIGGCAAVGLKLVQAARNLNSVLRAVKILLESVEGNWRNCEAMEQNNGFAVLAEVLRQKVGFSAMSLATRKTSEIDMTTEECESFLSQLLRVILRFVGYDEEHPAESLIINPLAYRVLLVDLELWRQSTSLETQKLYYAQFADFARGSKHHHYNAKRFHRIRVVKRLTDALKGETFSSQTFPFFLDAFRVLLQINFNGENARSLSLFITYALHDSRAAFAKRTLRPKASTMRLRRGTPPTMTPGSTPRSASPSQDPNMPPGIPLPELGVAILGMLTELLCDKSNYNDILRFAKNVTGKWLLYLLAEPDQRVVILGARILARLLVSNGPHFVKKFSEKNGGFVMMKNRLKHWWNTPGIWTICFAILFDRDVAGIDFERDFDVFNLVDIFITHSPHAKLRVIYSEVFPVITAMLETGLRAIVRDQAKPENETPKVQNGDAPVSRGRRRTMSLNAKQPTIDSKSPQSERLNNFAVILNSAIQFLSELHSRSENFRDFTSSSNYVQELLFVLYPVIVTSDSVSAETELLSRGSALTFEGQDVVIQPLSKANSQQAPIVRTTNVQPTLPTSSSQRVIPFRRASSFVLVSADKSNRNRQAPRLNPTLDSTNSGPIPFKIGSTVAEAMVEVVQGVFQDQLFYRKDFPGLGLFLKTPPGFQEHQAYFETYILRHTISSVKSAIQLDQKLLHEPRVLTNLARFVTHISEAVFEGWFLGGAESLLDFAGFLLEYLERPDVCKIKSVRLCTQAVGTIRAVFLRVVLLRLAQADDTEDASDAIMVIEKMVYWQPIILSAENTEGHFLKLICYLLYQKLTSSHDAVRLAAANFWRLLLVQKPEDASAILSHAMHSGKKELYEGFQKLVELDNETFLVWLDNNKSDLDAFFSDTMAKVWEDFLQDQNKKIEDMRQKRIEKRREKLKQWQADELLNENLWSTHENSTNHWRSNIHASERIKHQRVLQDQQDNTTFLSSVMAKLEKQIRGPCALFEDSPASKWRLDETEGRDRKRMRTIIDSTNRDQNYQPKRKDTDPVTKDRLKLDTAVPSISAKDAVGVTPIDREGIRPRSGTDASKHSAKNDSESDIEEDFEMVEAMYEDEDGFEDKNRKVMRSLQRGDQVQYVCNVSRVVGLEAVEGLLIVGKDCLYLLDDFFQRSDGEIVRVWQAPTDERDPYVQVIAGKQAITNRRPPPRDQDETTRYWKWSEVISISKRRFLHRDVAIEIFFDDGRSYLLTAISAPTRNDLHSRLLTRAPHVVKPELLGNSEISWRLDSLRNPEEVPQTFGSRFASAFSSVSSHPATKKWLKGEVSNFHYLMFVNTLAGRTFNDLTQYPVFPWVIADYTSDELDLTNPKSFRDLSKPMGCQNLDRETEFRERYKSFAEMGEAAQAFHYGTHYSSAMTVASYLIRLQPFSAAYFLIQGNTFDHADRLFYSIKNAWNSASKENMTDVRELTPEFFYLPEFLTNINGYNFGVRNTGENIDDVELPPWAKGDPAIFIAKQREALESPYVNKNLHHWIDLIFGFQQRGEAAIEAVNVFHHLTYHGSIDLDSITEEVQRVANINIINNFGQTPLQVFQRPHPKREENVGKIKRLDSAAESLHRLPMTLLESNDRVSSLAYMTKSDKILCSAPFRHNIPPNYDRYMEWGFTDGSVRFYGSDSKRLLGLFEHLHSGQLTTSLFVDGRTLITAGTDCTVALWNVIKGEKNAVDLQLITMLFGHKSPVVTIASSRAFSAFLSASSDGKVFLWDLNRSEFVRELDLGPAHRRNPFPIQAAKINNVTGHIILACGSRLLISTLNGRLLLDQNVCDGEDDVDGITAVAVYEGVANEWCERELIFTGHRRGVVKIFHLSPNTKTGTWTITLIKVLNHIDSTREDGGNFSAPVTCILPMPHNVYTGDEDGRVYEWDCVHRHAGH